MEIYYTLEVSNDGSCYQEVSCKSVEWVAGEYDPESDGYSTVADQVGSWRRLVESFEGKAYDIASSYLDDLDGSESSTWVRINLRDEDLSAEICVEDFGGCPEIFYLHEGRILSYEDGLRITQA